MVKKLRTEEKIKIRVQKAWDALAKYGIYTEEQLDEAIKKTTSDQYWLHGFPNTRRG